MNKSTVITKLLYDYLELSQEEILEYCKFLSNKELRHIAAVHPDNKTRKIFFRLTNVEIGEGVVINQNFIVSDNYEQLLKIGDRVAISPNVTIICASAPNNSNLNHNEYVKSHLIVEKEVIIGNDCWIGANVTILPGVKISNGCIIGAGSVVIKDTLPYSIYAGVPAKFVREIL